MLPASSRGTWGHWNISLGKVAENYSYYNEFCNIIKKFKEAGTKKNQICEIGGKRKQFQEQSLYM